MRWDEGGKRVVAVERMLYCRSRALRGREGRRARGGGHARARRRGAGGRAAGVREGGRARSLAPPRALRHGWSDASILSPERRRRRARGPRRGVRRQEELRTALREAGLLARLRARLGHAKAGAARAPRPRAPHDGGRPQRRRDVRGRQAPPPLSWMESHLQDFFGVRETPRVGDGRVPVVLHPRRCEPPRRAGDERPRGLLGAAPPGGAQGAHGASTRATRGRRIRRSPRPGTSARAGERRGLRVRRRPRASHVTSSSKRRRA